jgi:hypothetical protein
MPDITPDGNALFGSEILTVTNDAGTETYIAESLDFSFPTDTVTLQDESGNDNNNVYISRSIEGSATVQINNSQVMPKRGNTFDLDIDSTTYTFTIVSSSLSRSNSDFSKASIEFRQRLNP